LGGQSSVRSLLGIAVEKYNNDRKCVDDHCCPNAV
jgi:hypothetical protein